MLACHPRGVKHGRWVRTGNTGVARGCTLPCLAIFEGGQGRQAVAAGVVSYLIMPSLRGNAESLNLSNKGPKQGNCPMTFERTVTMLALAQEALDRFENNADAARAYLSKRLRDDGELRETLVKSAIEYERQERLHSS